MKEKRSTISGAGLLAGCFFAALALLFSAATGQAALTHRYSFNNNVNDSVGGAHGTIHGNAFISDGAAFFPGQSNADYIELPSGLISNYTSVSFEFWIDAYDNGAWQEVYAFGNQTTDGLGANMLMFTAHSGSSPPDFRMSYAQGSPGYTDERVVNGTGVLDNIGPVSVVCVYDPPRNSMSLYTNGTLVSTLSPVTTGAKGFSLTNVHNVRSWLGRSLYNGDAPYHGAMDEFRIYNEPLGPLQIYVNNAAGPNTVVSNIEVNSLNWNVQETMVVGTRQDTTVTFNTASYGSVTLPGATEAIYSSSTPDIVSVDERGRLLAKTAGAATVSASYNNQTNNITISISEPQLVHRYSFASDASDSVGNAHGRLVGSATISGGAVQLPGGTSSSDPSVSYVDLPNNLVSGLTAITVEAWVTDNGSGNWSRVWDFGNSAGGEDVSDTGSRYMFLTFQSGGGNLLGNIRINDRGADNTVQWDGGRPPVGQRAHVVWATDAARRTGWLYANGALVGVSTDVFVTPSDIGTSVNNWLGRSQFGSDAAFNGSIHELRIYNGPISSFQVALNAAVGPDTLATDPGQLQSLELTLGTQNLYYGGMPVTASLVAQFERLADINVTAAEGVVFQSSDSSVATVASSGTINAVGTGTTVITATFGGRTATLPLTVTTRPGYTPATLAHRYSFGESPGSQTVSDSAGTAHGRIAGNGAVFDGQGQLTLPGGTGSAADPIAAYVDLPNHIISVMTDISIEAWVTWQGSGSWQRIFDFGTSAAGEDISAGNGNYLFLSPQGPSALRFSVRDPETNAEPAPLTSQAPLPANQEVYVAVTYDYTGNVARLYSNAVLVASAPAPVALAGIDDVNNWLGRSQWNDPVFQGKYNEFRIWNGVLLPGQIASHHAAGPDSTEPLPQMTASATGNTLTLSWPASATGFVLQSSAQLGTGANWTAAPVTPSTAGGVTTATLPIGPGTQFFRLVR
jgi:hypothetical protein